jgi:hypothetical protein
LISRRVVSDLLITWTALPTTSAGRFSPLGLLGEDDPFTFKNLVNSMDDFRDGVVRSPERQQVISFRVIPCVSSASAAHITA